MVAHSSVVSDEEVLRSAPLPELRQGSSALYEPLSHGEKVVVTADELGVMVARDKLRESRLRPVIERPEIKRARQRRRARERLRTPQS